MKKSIFLILPFCVSFFQNLTAQQEALLDQMKVLEQEISDVDLGRYQYDQQLIYERDNPTQITLNIEATDSKKGKSEQLSATFNLALLSKSMIRRVSAKEEMKVVIRARKDIMQIYEEGEWDGYDKEFEIMCQDIDAAKILEQTLKATIPFAQEYWTLLNPIADQVEALLIDLLLLVHPIETEVHNIEQDFRLDQDFMDIVDLKQSDKDALRYQFSLGDMDAKSVDYGIKSDKVLVNLKAKRGREFILVEEEDGNLEYTDEVQLFMPDAAQADLVVKILKKAIPLCDSLIQLRLPKPENQLAASKEIQSLLIPYGFNENSYTQTINTDCKATYTIVEEEEKETEELSYKFHWGDLDPKSKTIELGKEQIEVVLNVKGKERYVELRENSELDGFKSNLKLYAPTVEAARYIISLVDTIITGCPVALKAKTVRWLDDNLAAISEIEEEFSQNLEADASDPCQMTFTTRDKDDSEHYEFNFSTLNMKSLELSIKGKTVAINVETKGDEKTISHYDEKGDISYEDELEFFFPNVEAGRTALLTFKDLGKRCKN